MYGHPVRLCFGTSAIGLTSCFVPTLAAVHYCSAESDDTMTQTATNGAGTAASGNPSPSDEEFSKFFDLSRDLLSIASTDGYFKKINPAFSETLGYSEKYLLSKPFIYFVHPEDKPSTQDEIEQLTKSADTVNFENRFRCKDKSYRWLSWMYRRDDSTGMLYAVARDITESKKKAETTTEKRVAVSISHLWQ